MLKSGMEAFGGVQVVRITFWRVSSLATVVFAASPCTGFPAKSFFGRRAEHPHLSHPAWRKIIRVNPKNKIPALKNWLRANLVSSFIIHHS
jgi:hypothetical protein